MKIPTPWPPPSPQTHPPRGIGEGMARPHWYMKEESPLKDKTQGVAGVLLSLLLVADGDGGAHFCHNLVDLCAGKGHVLVDLLLVLLVDLGQGEESHDAEGDQGEAVEPGAQVRQAPEQSAELDGVHDVLDEEEPLELREAAVELRHNHVGGLVHLVGGQGGVGLEQGLERVSLAALLHGLHHILVDPEDDGAGEGGQGGVGDHGDEGEVRQGDEQHQGGAEHSPGLLQVPPVDQLNQWVYDGP